MALQFDTGNLAEGIENGIQWATRTAPIYGAVNGYVKLPADHPWCGLDLQFSEGDVDVHGGVTYGPDALGWIGFDTTHYLDEWPGMPDRMIDRSEHSMAWTPEKVVAEAKRLARQVAEAVAS